VIPITRPRPTPRGAAIA